MVFLEVACFNVDSAVIAAHSGADRLEFCRDRASGGLTPDYASLVEVRSQVKIPVFVMIRPRPGNFVCTTTELEEMKNLVSIYKNQADGFVFGILNHDFTVNRDACTMLVQMAHPLPCTFHRAFDQTTNMSDSLEELIRCGFSSVLTSGGGLDAVAGLDQLIGLVKQAGTRIDIIVGGGVRTTNWDQLSSINPAAYHTAAIRDDGEIADAAEVGCLKLKTIKLLRDDMSNT